MTEPRPQLDYAPAQPLYRRRGVRRAAVTAVLLAVVVVVGYHYLEPIGIRVRLLAAQRRVAAMTYPPTQVAWEEDPARIAAWTGGGATFGPGWATLGGTSGRVEAAYVVPPAFRELFEIPGTVGSGVSAVYAGARDAGAGRRIVAVCIEGRPYQFMRPPGEPLPFGIFRVVTLRPATLAAGPSFRAVQWSDDGTLDRIPAGQLRLYWGQPDPADAAHFTIRYESPAAAGTIDGRLMPDDSVQLKVVPGPTTAPSR